ncbi:MAG: hypothetical protein K6F73_08540 [Lachnospiraceae bacterium]|nr:hypothetical protein [Lachnospiraceae bacterium]
MHIGCCENCRYVDLLEYLTGGCPRCGGRMAPLGLKSSEWNDMSVREREAAIAGLFSEDEDSDAESAADDGSETIPSGNENAYEDEHAPEEVAEAEAAGEYVYVCYKCSTIAAHDGAKDSYFCPECGADMVPVGISTDAWTSMTKEEKRKASEDAKIRHMVNAIKNASIDDGESEKTQNIINVV